MLWFYIALGGSIGALARYGVTLLVQPRAGTAFPWGTLAANLLGCLLIGFATRFAEALPLSANTRGFIAVGLIGAFTTFSTFSYETLALLEDGLWLRAATYSIGSVLLSLLLVYAGMRGAGLFLHA